MCLGLLMVASIFKSPHHNHRIPKIRRDRGGFLLEGNKMSACFFCWLVNFFGRKLFPNMGTLFAWFRVGSFKKIAIKNPHGKSVDVFL